jgi:hypothetical protein
VKRAEKCRKFRSDSVCVFRYEGENSLYHGDVPYSRAATVTETSRVHCCPHTGQCLGKRQGSTDRCVLELKKVTALIITETGAM